MPPPSFRRAATCLATLAALATTGCDQQDTAPTPLLDPPSSDTPSTPATSAPQDQDAADAPITAYRDWLAALAARDAAAACARQAPQLTIDLRFEAILLGRARLGDPCVDFVAVQWEQPQREYDVLGLEATQVTDEDALLAVDFEGVDQSVRMIEDGTRWLVAESVPRTSAGAGDGPRRWLAAWCDLELGMAPTELTALMGPPSGVYTIADGGEPQLYWTLDQYDFRAYLDSDPPNGRTIDLVGDYDRLGAAERSALTCPELR